MTHPRRLLVALVATLATLAGCTGEAPPPTSPPVNAPALPGVTFTGLPDRGAGVGASIDALVSDGSTILSVQTVDDLQAVPLLRSSTDAGATWTDGALSPAAAEATQVGEATLDVAAVTPRGEGRLWLAMGQKRDSLFAWTSSEARNWERTPITGIHPAKGERVSSVAGLDDGSFIAVGGRILDEKHLPRVWTSPDGIAWTAQKVPGEGWLDEVTASGTRVVAVGSRGLPALKNGRSQYSLLFTSTDRGVRWKRVSVQEPPSSSRFVSYLTDAVATASGFVVGGSFFDGVNDTYQPFLLSTTDLISWKAVLSLPRVGQASHLSELLRVGSATVALQSVSSSGEKDRLRVSYLFDDDRSWTTASSPGSAQNLSTSGGVAVGDTAVLSVTVDGNPTHDRLWRFDSPGRVNQVDIEPPADSRTNVQPHSLLVADGRLTVFGLAQGTPALWPADGGSFGAPVAVPVESNESLDRILWSADGGYLATGDVDGGNAVVRRSQDGTTWRTVKPTTFNKVSQYHWSTINDAVWAHGRWVVVGAKSSNGSVRESGLVYTSADGGSWQQGRPARVTARGDWYDKKSPLDDLHGLDNRGRQLASVIGVDRGLIATGWTMKDSDTRPAAWVSTDTRTWRLVGLDSGGYPDAVPGSVQRVGTVLVAQGWARAAGASRVVRARWRSTDGGRHWRFTAVKGERAGWVSTSSDTEFLQVVTADDERSVTLSRSADGVTWHETPIAIAGLTEGMEVSVGDAVVHDGALHLLVTLANRLDAVTVVQRVEL